LKDEFSTGVPQIATAVAVILGTLGLQQFGFNAGAWTVIAVFTFCLVFLYRRYVPSSLARMTAWMGSFFILAFSGAALLYHLRDPHFSSLDAWLLGHPYGASAYASFVSTAILACLVTSYRKQELLGGHYPVKIESALAGEFYSLPFYKKDVKFRIEMEEPDSSGIKVRTTHSYTVVNRTRSPREWRVQYNLNDKNGSFDRVVVGKTNIDLDGHPGYKTGRGIDIPVDVKKEATIEIVVIDRFEARDSEIYTSYHPATDLRIEIKYPKECVRCYFDVLHSSRSEPKIVTAGKMLVLEGLLPYQGARLYWNTTKGGNSGAN
jgi:hypothetical protein